MNTPSHTSSISSLLLACLLFVFAGIASPALAQYEVDPEELFFEYLDAYAEYSDGIDLARSEIASQFGDAIATEIAIRICFENTEECEYAFPASDVLNALIDFTEEIFEFDMSVDDAIDLISDFYDDYLVLGVGVYWCSPPASQGCAEGSVFNDMWTLLEGGIEEEFAPYEYIAVIAEADPKLGELMGAAYCGEPTCYAAEFAALEDDDLYWEDDLTVVETEKSAEQVTRQNADAPAAVTPPGASGGDDLKFANNPGSPRRGLKSRLRCLFNRSSCN